MTWVVPVTLSLDLLFGLWLWPKKWSHPIAILGRIITFFDHNFNSPKIGSRQQFYRGGVITFLIVGSAALLGYGLQLIAWETSVGWLIYFIIALPLMAQQSLYTHVAAVASALDKNISAGRLAVASIVGRDTTKLDEAGIARAAIESCAESFCDAVVAPALWFFLCGLPGLLAYKTISTLDSMIGYRNSRYEYFGKVAARLDDVANYLPARLAAVIFLIAAFFVRGCSPKHGARILKRDATLHASPNAGWPEAAVAGILNLRLGGPRIYETAKGKSAEMHWIGDDNGHATARDIHLMLRLYLIACSIHILLWGLIILLLHNLHPL